jgi:hypothetical protein
MRDASLKAIEVSPQVRTNGRSDVHLGNARFHFDAVSGSAERHMQ